jgi:hypothetical protein
LVSQGDHQVLADEDVAAARSGLDRRCGGIVADVCAGVESIYIKCARFSRTIIAPIKTERTLFSEMNKYGART